MLKSRFFWRNFLSYVVVISLTTFVVSYLLTVKTEEFVRSDTHTILIEKASLMTPILSRSSTISSTPQELAQLFPESSRRSDMRVTVIAQNGSVIYESEVDHKLLPNHISRPEIQEASEVGWGYATRFSDTLKVPMIYVAKRIDRKDGTIFLRLALSMNKLEQRLEDIRYVLGIGALVGMFGSLLIALWLAKRITKPIADITNVAEAISRGNYNARLRYFPKNELGTLGRSINRLAEAVQANISKRENMEKIRREFSSNVSHELKTPLTSIKGYVETLQAGALEDREVAVRFLDVIAANIERITSLVTDLLRLSTIEANQGIISLEDVDWGSIITEVATRHKINLQNKGILLTLPDDPKAKVRGNRKAMTHILDNLLQNAINYTPRNGHISVNIKNDDHQTILSVQDTGIGISPKDQSRIFERFYRVDAARSRDDGGTGLGLAIVKHLVMQIQGSIDVKSELGKGSVFIVNLPSC